MGGKKLELMQNFISLARTINLNITEWVLKEIFKNDPKTKNLNTKKKF